MFLEILLAQVTIVEDYSAYKENITWSAQCKFGEFRMNVENGRIIINGVVNDSRSADFLLSAINDRNHKILCNDALRQFQVVHSVQLTGTSGPKVTFVARIDRHGKIVDNRPFVMPEKSE